MAVAIKGSPREFVTELSYLRWVVTRLYMCDKITENYTQTHTRKLAKSDISTHCTNVNLLDVILSIVLQEVMKHIWISLYYFSQLHVNPQLIIKIK